MSDHADLGRMLAAALHDWRTARAAGDHDTSDDACDRATPLACVILDLPAPSPADLPHVLLAFGWRCAGGIPTAADDPHLHAAARRLLQAFEALPDTPALAAA